MAQGFIRNNRKKNLVFSNYVEKKIYKKVIKSIV